MGSGWWSVVGTQWLIVWGKYPISSDTFMIPWQAGSSILKVRNFFARATLAWSITQTTSKWSGPVNLLTHEVSGQWPGVRGQRLEVRGQWGWGMDYYGIEELRRRKNPPNPPLIKGGEGGFCIFDVTTQVVRFTVHR